MPWGKPWDGGEKPPAWDPGPGNPGPRKPGDRQDCQRISGKRRRKSMAVLSVPGAQSPRERFFMKFRGTEAHLNRHEFPASWAGLAAPRRLVLIRPFAGRDFLWRASGGEDLAVPW